MTFCFPSTFVFNKRMMYWKLQGVSTAIPHFPVTPVHATTVAVPQSLAQSILTRPLSNPEACCIATSPPSHLFLIEVSWLRLSSPSSTTAPACFQDRSEDRVIGLLLIDASSGEVRCCGGFDGVFGCGTVIRTSTSLRRRALVCSQHDHSQHPA
jgi:hypothetical protein